MDGIAESRVKSRMTSCRESRCGSAQPLGDDIEVTEVNLLLREMVELVARPACYGSSLDLNPDHLSKIQNGQHKQRSGQHTQ